jgi:hypothetical protein
MERSRKIFEKLQEETNGGFGAIRSERNKVGRKRRMRAWRGRG